MSKQNQKILSSLERCIFNLENIKQSGNVNRELIERVKTALVKMVLNSLGDVE